MERRKGVALALIPKITGGFSMTSSFLIILSVLRKKREERSTVYHRLMLGMSIADFISSFTFALSTWPVPEDSGMVWAVGNQRTCTMQGFMVQAAGAATPIYSASLSIYYLFVIRYKWNEERIKSIEPWLHIPAIVWAWCTAIAGLPLEVYNPATLWCFISPGPGLRGERAGELRMLFFYVPVWVCAMMITINLAIVTMHVRGITTEALVHSTAHLSNPKSNMNKTDPTEDGQGQSDDECSYDENGDELEKGTNTNQPLDHTEKAANTDSFRGDSNEIESDESRGAERKRAEEMRKNRYAKWRSKVASQCLRYAVAFYIAWLPISIVRMQQMKGKDEITYTLLVLSAINTPLLGVPNFLAFFYPKIVKYTKKRPGLKPFFRAFWVPTKSSRADEDVTDQAIPHTSGRLMRREGSVGASQIDTERGGDSRIEPAHLVSYRVPNPDDRIGTHESDRNAQQATGRLNGSTAPLHTRTGFAARLSSITMSEASEFYPIGRIRMGRRGMVSATSSITIPELDPFEEGIEFNVPQMPPMSSGASADSRPNPPTRTKSGNQSIANASKPVIDANPRLPRHPTSEFSLDDSGKGDDGVAPLSEKESTTESTTRASLDFSPKVPPRSLSGGVVSPSVKPPSLKHVGSNPRIPGFPGLEDGNVDRPSDRAPDVPNRVQSIFSEVDPFDDDSDDHDVPEEQAPLGQNVKAMGVHPPLHKLASDILPRIPSRASSASSRVGELEAEHSHHKLFRKAASTMTGFEFSQKNCSDDAPILPGHILSEHSTGDSLSRVASTRRTDAESNVDSVGDAGPVAQPSREGPNLGSDKPRTVPFRRYCSDVMPTRPRHVLSEYSTSEASGDYR